MEFQMSNHPHSSHVFVKRPPPPIKNNKAPVVSNVRWIREWVPQETASRGKKCSLLKWVREDTLNALKEKCQESEPEELKDEPTTEILYLCSYEGCHKSFADLGAYRKHSHIHGERQYACNVPGCGKKFLDSSKLKRHQVVHTGVKDHICPHEGCGKAFNLDFNLRAHMRTHSQENYHVCPYLDCGKRYTQECKLKSHIKTHHDKNTAMDVIKPMPPAEKLHSTPKATAGIYGSASSGRPYVCPYEGCGKDYIHEYKLNLHLRREHPDHKPEQNGRSAPATDHIMEEAGDQDAYIANGGVGKNLKRSRPNPIQKIPPAKITHQKGLSLAPMNVNVTKKQWPREAMYEDDSEETEEDNENVEEDDGWMHREVNNDDEETEDDD